MNQDQFWAGLQKEWHNVGKYTELQEQYIEHQMQVHNRLQLGDALPWLMKHAELKHALADIEGATMATLIELDAEAKARARKERGV